MPNTGSRLNISDITPFMMAGRVWEDMVYSLAIRLNIENRKE